MASKEQCILDSLKDSWEQEFTSGIKNKDNCSGFAKSVMAKLGIPMAATANADGIASAVAASRDWAAIASGVDAAKQAANGVFVLAVLKSGDHSPARNNGHVAVVVNGQLYRGKYPLVWGGSLGSAQSQGNKSVGEVWNTRDRDNVKYYSYTPGASCP